MQAQSTTANRASLGRSKVTNGSLLIDGVTNGRSRSARRFRDLVAAYCAEIGTAFEALTESQRTIVRQVAGLALQCEVLQAQIVNGQLTDTEELVRCSNLLARLQRQLGIGRVKPAAAKRTLADIMAKPATAA